MCFPLSSSSLLRNPLLYPLRFVSALPRVLTHSLACRLFRFWLAETLKYLLLLFSDDEALDLSSHVINTEAHPLRVFNFSDVRINSGWGGG